MDQASPNESSPALSMVRERSIPKSPGSSHSLSLNVSREPTPVPVQSQGIIRKSLDRLPAWLRPSLGNSDDCRSAPGSGARLRQKDSIQRYLVGTLWRLLTLVLILTVLITFSIIYRIKGNPPKESLDKKVWYTDKFRLRIPEDLGNAVLWNTPVSENAVSRRGVREMPKEVVLDMALKEKPREDEDPVSVGRPWPVGHIQVPSNGKALLPNPRQLPIRLTKDGLKAPTTTRQLLAEFHSHTTKSDGRLEPPQLVDWALAYGFQVLFVTDHNTISGGLAARAYAEESGRSQEILVIPGVEFTCCRIHMNLLGINETIKPTMSWPSDEELRTVIRRTHELGGVVIVNHLPWSQSLEGGRRVPTLQRHPTREQLRDWGVDGFECVAEGVLDLPTIRFVEKEGMPYITATDIHNPEDMPHAWTVLNVPVAEDLSSSSSSPPSTPFLKFPAQGITERAVLDVLRSKVPHSTNFYYDPIGPQDRVYAPSNPARDWYLPLTHLDFLYFWTENSGMYSFVNGFCHDRVFYIRWRAVAGFVAWCVVAFTLYEVTRFAVLKGWNVGMDKVRSRLLGQRSVSLT